VSSLRPRAPTRPRVNRIVVRRFQADDSIKELTALLHRAYRGLAARGLNFTASYQDEALTAARMRDGICLIGIIEKRIIATATIYQRRTSLARWYSREGLASFGQFAVDPAYQRRNIGTRLLQIVEKRAKRLGCRELALDTAKAA